MTPSGERYLTIERNGAVLYESRTDVPIGMTKFTAAYEKNKAARLKRQEEIDRENAAAPPGVHTEQMGNFRD
jgi:hypothetical protein